MPRPSRCTLPLGFALAVAACHRQPPGGDDTRPGLSASAPATSSSAQIPRAKVTGIVRGRVRIEGDPSPTRASVLEEIPAECPSAREFYAATFRRAADGALADALVAVTGYREDPPARRPFETVTAAACRLDKRTVVLSSTQRLAVVANDRFGYVPTLLGGNSPLTMIPIPGGEPVELAPPKPGRYLLIDEAHNFIRADVFVVGYPTFDVTGVDGRFEIPEVPVGPVKVNALLPALMLTTEGEVVVRANEATEVELTLRYDAAAHRVPASASALPSASAVPPASSAAPR